MKIKNEEGLWIFSVHGWKYTFIRSKLVYKKVHCENDRLDQFIIYMHFN